MKYFTSNPQTQEALKREYRRLSKIHHPDNNGGSAEANEIMAQINAEYTALFAIVGYVFTNAKGENYTKQTAEVPQDFIELIAKLIKLDGLDIEIIGSFVWVSGNTKPHKEVLKELKFKWHGTKKCWFLAPDDYRKRSRKDYSMDTLRTMYGSNGTFTGRGDTNIVIV